MKKPEVYSEITLYSGGKIVNVWRSSDDPVYYGRIGGFIEFTDIKTGHKTRVQGA